MMIALLRKRESYDGLDWERDSLAVVASNGKGNGVILWTVGPHVRFEINERGFVLLGDLGLDDAPEGISVWVGKYIWTPGSYEHYEDGSWDPVGKFREPTEAEWLSIRNNKCPWDEEEWRAKDSKPDGINCRAEI